MEEELRLSAQKPMKGKLKIASQCNEQSDKRKSSLEVDRRRPMKKRKKKLICREDKPRGRKPKEDKKPTCRENRKKTKCRPIPVTEFPTNDCAVLAVVSWKASLIKGGLHA